MAQKQSIFGRIAQLAKANINAMLDAAEDPEKMIDQMIRDYTDNIAEAEAAVAQTIGNLRLMEQDRETDVKVGAEWGTKALAASNKADQLRAEGQTAEADRFDGLAKVALRRQLDAEGEIATADPQIASQTEVVAKLKDGINGMRTRLDELKSKRNELVARAKTVKAQSAVNAALGAVDIMDPTSELSRFEDRIRREEATVAGQTELAASSLDAQFSALDDDLSYLDVEARLAQLKESSREN